MSSAKKRFLYEPLKKPPKGVRIKLFSKDTKQTHVTLGFHSIKRNHKLKYALRLLNIILGGNMSSRLFERLREKKALCYEISSSAKSYKETGNFIIHAGVGNEKLCEASEEIIHELVDIRENTVSSDELYRAKEYYRGQFLLALESTATRMLWLGEKIMAEGKARSIKEIFANINKVSAEDIRKVAGIIFTDKNMNYPITLALFVKASRSQNGADIV